MDLCVHGTETGGGGKYFPGIPQDFPTKGDIRVARALVRMARMLHGFVESSSHCFGHERRLGEHQTRIRASAGLRRARLRHRVPSGDSQAVGS